MINNLCEAIFFALPDIVFVVVMASLIVWVIVGPSDTSQQEEDARLEQDRRIHQDRWGKTLEDIDRHYGRR